MATTRTLTTLQNPYTEAGTDDYIIVGNSLNNTITANVGNDSLFGAAGNDSLRGLAGNDTLNGDAGNDTMDGGSGNDSLIGGLGNDYFVIDSLSDVVLEASAGGTDSVITNITGYTLANEAEVLILGGSVEAGTGNSLNNTLVGNGSANSLNGAAGNDSLFGAADNDTLEGGAGNDSLVGGTGNDYYIIEAATDLLTENAAEGTDSVLSKFSGYTLAGNAEVLILDGTVAVGTGNSLANTLVGNSAANTLNGGADNDSLSGGAGNDLYVIDSLSDVVSEASASGTDSVRTSVTGYTLTNHVEALILEGSVASGTGNSLANTLVGNSANNTLSGLDGNDRMDGGIGNDTLVGGKGNDYYVIDSALDVISETSGLDSVEARFAGSDTLSGYILTDVAEVLVLGSTIAGGTGNSLANTLFGNSANNRLDGAAGIDSLVGGAGNDFYVVDLTADKVFEGNGQGTDSVLSNITKYTLANNAEVLILNGSVIEGTGNSLNNTLIGNSANNVLNGGAGIDSLVGGTGNDYYFVDSTTDVVNEAAASGLDSVSSSITGYTLAGNAEVLILSGSVVAGTGNSLNNTLIGNGATNSLDGGLGNDYFVINSVSDVVIEASAAGTDSVSSSVTGYTLVDNAEVLILAGSVAAGTGNSLNNTLIGNAATNTFTGGAGNDFYLVNSAADSVVEDAASGTDSVSASVSGYTLNDNVEVLILEGAVAGGTGNSLANSLFGNSVGNTLDGGAGNDTLNGGDGSDYYIVDSLLDSIVESTLAGGGTDSVLSNINGYTLAGNAEVLILGESVVAGNGNSIANTLVGNSIGNSLNGGAGIDSLVGGTGNDTYFVDSSLDRIYELLNPTEQVADIDIDTVVSTISYSLKTNLENLVLAGAAYAGTGNALNNTITGNSLANRLNGSTGADTLIGNGGNDIFVVDDRDDSVAGGAALDTVESRIQSYTLTGGIENLSLIGTQAVNGTGNALSNAVFGNHLDNRLNGIANSGTIGDQLFGGEGDDTLVVNRSFDYTEGGDGTDLVESTADYTIGFEVENLTLLGTALRGEGNEQDNVITGNALNNTLDGAYGSDYLAGGAGNDVYIIDESDDVYEESDMGTDLIQVSFEYSSDWMVDNNVENIRVVGNTPTIIRGNSMDNVITDSDSDNTVYGGEGDDTIYGSGGADSIDGSEGYDFLFGGSGDDTIVADAYDFVVNGEGGSDWMISGSDLDLSDGRTVSIENVALIEVYELDPETGDTFLSSYQPTIAIGNSLNNQLFGNLFDNIIDGGIGSDILSGGAGSDTLTVDAADSLIDGGEDGEYGVDWVISNDSVSLADGRIYGVENIVLTGLADSTATGDDSDNFISGNDGDNTILGGLGVDFIDGGSGDDSILGGEDGGDLIFGGNGSDTLYFETSSLGGFDGGDGVDCIVSNQDVTMQNLYSVETMVLIGSANITATGDYEMNEIIGNSGNNTLNGLGNFDTLTGGAGADVFVIGDATGQYYGNDFEGDSCFAVITDFTVGTDRLQLKGASAGSYVVDSSDPTQVLINSTNDSIGLVANINVVSGNAGQILNNAVFVA